MFTAELNSLALLQSLRTDFFNTFFELITLLGEETILVIIIALTYFMFDKKLAGKIVLITATSLSINSIIKNFIKLPRPFVMGDITCLRPDTATGYSFPSGHTQNFATWSMAFSVHLKKRWLIVLSVILTSLLAFSRLYLGAHYPSDVIAGAILGFSLAISGDIVYDKISQKKSLHYLILILFLPFAVFFVIKPDPLFEDFFKFYGLLAGFVPAHHFEERFVHFDFNCSRAKKTIRVILAVITAYLFKELFHLINFDNIRYSLIWDTIRYFILSFTIFAFCPMLFKKIKL